MRLVLVVGCQRSGTTLLGQMLGAHPSALLVDENEGCYEIVDALREAKPLRPVLERVLPGARRKYRDARRDDAADPSHLVLKAPNATFARAALVARGLPLSFVFAVRDVREVVHSMARLAEVPIIANQQRRMAADPAIAARFPRELALLSDPAVPDHCKFATIWQVRNSLHRDYRAAPAALLVRYGELVAGPEAWLARLHDHVGLPRDPLQHHAVMTGTGPGRTARDRAVDSGSRARWTGSLDEPRLRDIHAIAGGLMEELGLPW